MKTKTKFLYGILAVVLSGLLLVSCQKDSEGVSKTLIFPEIAMTGNQYMQVLVGSTFTDPGVEAFAGDEELAVTTTGSVNTSTPGLYSIVYSATKEGDIPATISATRYVLVTSATPADLGIVGTYLIIHATRVNQITVTELSPGLYIASDSWFQGSRIPVQFADMNGGLGLEMIPATQSSNYGNFDGTVTFDSEILSFTMILRGGINDGVSWATRYTKL